MISCKARGAVPTCSVIKAEAVRLQSDHVFLQITLVGIPQCGFAVLCVSQENSSGMHGLLLPIAMSLHITINFIPRAELEI
jgi:hypothetical protein